MNLSQNDVVLFQGDSITDCGRNRQVQDTPNEAWQLGVGYANFTASALLADNPARGVKIFNRGNSGNRIVDLYARLREDTLNLRPTLLSVLIGVNDTWHHFQRNAGVGVEKFERVYRAYLEETRAELPAVRLVLCEPFVLPCGVVMPEWVTEMNERQAVVRRLAEKFEATFVPFQGMFDAGMKQAPAEYWAGDGVHPTPAGHMLMSRTWLKHVGG